MPAEGDGMKVQVEATALGMLPVIIPVIGTNPTRYHVFLLDRRLQWHSAGQAMSLNDARQDVKECRRHHRQLAAQRAKRVAARRS
jgi:hypothetical protein